MEELLIRGRADGPLMVPGPVQFVNKGGEELVKEGRSVSLCRCGGSARKPLCDGTHRRNQFNAPSFEVTVTSEWSD